MKNFALLKPSDDSRTLACHVRKKEILEADREKIIRDLETCP